MPTALIALGSNMGDRAEWLRSAVDELARLPGTRVSVVSGWRESAPVGGPADQEAFLNGAALIATTASPEALLQELLAIEQRLGRARGVRWGPRTVDLDLLLYDDARRASDALTLPHPRLELRRFVLEPAAEIAGDWVHPTLRRTLAELLDHLNTSAPYFAVAGMNRAAVSQLARALAEKLSAALVARDPGDGEQAALKWAPVARERLRAALSRGGEVVSDFWLGEFPATDVAPPTPRLLIRVAATEPGADERRAMKFTEQAREAGIPVLELPTAAPAEQLAAAVAAVEGMR